MSEVARHWQVCPQQVFGWRRMARQDVTTAPAPTTRSAAPGFVPIVAEATVPVTVARAAAAVPVIEVKLAGAIVRVVSALNDDAQLTAVLRAVRASAPGS